MYSLVYHSKATPNFSEPSLRALINHAQKKNNVVGITGFLYFDPTERVFLQYLEGDQSAVELLMDTINEDRRHSVTQVVVLEQWETHLFDDWTMRSVTGGHLRTVGLEDVLQQTLQALDRGALSTGEIQKIASLTIEKIAKLKQRLEVLG